MAPVVTASLHPGMPRTLLGGLPVPRDHPTLVVPVAGNPCPSLLLLPLVVNLGPWGRPEVDDDVCLCGGREQGESKGQGSEHDSLTSGYTLTGWPTCSFSVSLGRVSRYEEAPTMSNPETVLINHDGYLFQDPGNLQPLEGDLSADTKLEESLPL